MTVLLEIIVCSLAIIGVYAIFVRFIAWRMPKEELWLAVKGDELSGEEIASLIACVRLVQDTDDRVRPVKAILLDREDAEKEDTLRREGFLVYIRK